MTTSAPIRLASPPAKKKQTRSHYHRVHPLMRGSWDPNRPHDQTSFPAGSLSPFQVLTAYGFKQNQYANVTAVPLGIGSLGGGVCDVDLTNAMAAWGMPDPRPSLGIRTVGGATNNPADQDSQVENSLDLLIMLAVVWWLTGKMPYVFQCFGPNAGNGMTLVTNDLIAAGAKVVSWSWGSPKSSWDPGDVATLSSAFDAGRQVGVTFCAAAGDNSEDDGTNTPAVDFPSGYGGVCAVGGTNLPTNPDGSRGAEAAWGDGSPGDEGGGGGFDPSIPQPAWQVSIVPSGQGRGAPDVAACADPNTGWQISANGSWTVVGGTSAASPFIAALIAIAKGAYGYDANDGLLTPLLYVARAIACNDIVLGSNGQPAAPGWDAATGLGSPHGDSFLSSLLFPPSAPANASASSAA